MLLATAAWLTVGTQFWLSIRTALSDGGSVLDGIVSYFGYFTLLTNILCAAVVTAWVPVSRVRSDELESRSRGPGALLRRSGVMTTAATAIIIVGAVYHLLLAHLWDPQGIDLVVDTMLHTVLPIAFVLFWWRTVPRGAVAWREIPAWVGYPAGYALYILVRGAIIAEYPYPFIDVAELGYATALRNAGGIAIVFCAVAALLVGVNRFAGASRPPEP